MYTLEEVKDIIKNKINHEVLSKEYINATILLDIRCVCGVIYQKTLKTIKLGYYHCNGKRQMINKGVPIVEITCKNCKKVFLPSRLTSIFCTRLCKDSFPRSEESKQKTSNALKQTIIKICGFCQKEFISKKSCTKFCSKDCFCEYKKTDEYKEKIRKGGKKGGKISATSQQRRSKNEVCFAELCEDYFGKENVVCNVPMFNGWDADVIILNKKIAVLWNGIFHYKQIMKSQSLRQVQARDKIKWDVIIKNGYTPYEIKDMGKHSPNFVKQEFESFLFSLIEL